MKVERIVNSVFNSNTFIIHDEENAIIIDIGDIKPVKNCVKTLGLNVRALLLTHTHYDHFYGIREFMNLFPKVPVFTSTFGKEALRKPNCNFSRYHDDEISIESDSIKIINDNSIINGFDGSHIQIISTPGHDKSCLCYQIGDMLFTGDSYIPGVKVIASFPNSDKTEARRWYERLKDMAFNLDVYPGHGEISLRPH